MKPYQLTLHIFRRDLRLQDNSALIAALKSSAEVIPCFIFDDRQINHNDYKGSPSLAFMGHSLHELNAELNEQGSQLYCFHGKAEEVLEKLLTSLKIEAVFINRDYTPFSRSRDQHLKNICQQYQRDFHPYADALLNEPESALKPNGQPYTVFTPFMRRARLLPVEDPVSHRSKNYYQQPIANTTPQLIATLMNLKTPGLRLQGGRKEALQLLKKIPQLKNYAEIRNIPAEPGTTYLSAHHKFGTISVRETYAAVVAAFNKQHILINELYWRDFFTHVAFHFPHVFHGAFHPRFDNVHWELNHKHFQAWCQGLTGFPIVDAGMRELNHTGYMHNRVRMITASFLTKDLHIDWRHGEKYFAQQLQDYDPAVNNGNWQWSASTGCDAQPWFRIFNPWLQQKKFDPDCIYIKKWVPELSNLTPKEIHNLAEQRPLFAFDYPNPIVNHSVESLKSKQLFKVTAD